MQATAEETQHKHRQHFKHNETTFSLGFLQRRNLHSQIKDSSRARIHLVSMERVLRTLFSFRELKSSHDDDIIDRLTRIYTSSLLFLFCVIVTSSHYVGNVIQCWCPAEFTDSHKAYTNTICWVSNTYYVSMNEQIPTNDRIPRQMISYYQWVPFILLVQGILCYVPRLIWKFLSSYSGE